MRRWFLSYTSQDFAVMQALKSALQQRDPGVHLFFAPEAMRAGGFWQQQLADEVAQSTAFVLLVGEHGTGPWQVMEYYEALDRRAKEPNYPLILVLSGKRATAPGLPFARQLHWLVTDDSASEATIGKLIDAASGAAVRPGELWRHTRPYRGLEAMTEASSEFFFGRERETVEVIDALASEPGKLCLLLGNSGVGKSSLAQAGVLAALLRQTWPDQVTEAPPWPSVFDRSRHWCFLTLRPGTDPLKALVDVLLERWQFKAGAGRLAEEKTLITLLQDGKATLSDLLDQTERRDRELGQPSPPAFFLYIDQGEELYVRAEKGQRRRFSEIIATGLADPRLRALMSLRADFFGELLNDEALYRVHRLVKVPPLREAQLREVVSNPAKLLSARFQSDTLAADVARRAAEESADDTGALPLLSYLLDDMWSEMVERGDGMLRLPMQAIDLGLVLVERADRFIAERPAAEAALRRILTLKLATVREDGEPTRRRAARSEFGDEEWRLVSELADHPNRLLVTATPEGGETYAEVAHEAIFRRWDKLREWTAGEREFLAWKTGLEAARRAWQATPDDSKSDALLMGAALTQARSWWTKRGEDLTVGDRDFIDQSRRRESKARARARRAQAAIGVLMLGTIAGLLGVIFKDEFNAARFEFFTARPYVAANFTPHVLTPQAERALPPGASFRECAAGSRACPEMVVVPAGTFRMGSPDEEAGRHTSEEPVRTVTIPRPFAVGKFEVTWDEWEACVAMRGCDGRPTLDQGYGRGRKPVINVSWEQAKAYVAWLSRMTGKIYRLLTEAEWEYAARGVIGADAPHPPYPWDDDPAGLCRHANLADQSYRGVGYAGDIVNCDDGHAVTAAVGSYPANAFGLQDMHGNVWEWVEDGWHSSYAGSPPSNGSEWKDGADVSRRVVRGGCWFDDPRNLRSAVRDGFTSVDRFNGLGFRVARTLDR